MIFLFMVGGPSQIDTFDFKPELQRLDGQPVPDSFRKALDGSAHANVFHGCENKLLGSPYRWQQYGDRGMWVSELFPETAKHVDELCFIHSMQAESNNHAPASYQLHTGDIRLGKASLGSWVTYGLGTENEDLPGYVVLFDAGPLGGSGNYTNGFLPPAFQPTRLRDRGAPVFDLLPPDKFANGQRDSIDLIQQLNLLHRNEHPGATELDARIATYELAYRMQSAALEVSDFSDESQHIHQLYGLEQKEERTTKFRTQVFARAAFGRAWRSIRSALRHARQGWLGRAFEVDEEPYATSSMDGSTGSWFADRLEATRSAGKYVGDLGQRVWANADAAR